MYTRREIIETVIYGSMAHSNPRYKPIFEKWMQNYSLKPLILTEFTNIPINTLTSLNLVRNLNVKISCELT